jgi:hypothetical protein
VSGFSFSKGKTASWTMASLQPSALSFFEGVEVDVRHLPKSGMNDI